MCERVSLHMNVSCPNIRSGRFLWSPCHYHVQVEVLGFNLVRLSAISPEG